MTNISTMILATFPGNCFANVHLHNIIDKYASYLMFECSFHNKFYIYPSDDQGDAMALISFVSQKKKSNKEFIEWSKHLQPVPDEEMETLEMCTKCNQDQK
jgi:hypothetical protein